MKYFINSLIIVFFVVVVITQIIEPIWKFTSNNPRNIGSTQDKNGTPDIKNDSVLNNNISTIASEERNVIANNMIGNIEEEGYLYLIVNEFIESINNKNYQQAYALLSKDFKDIYYPNINSFKAFCNKSLSKNGKGFYISEYENLGRGRYICDVRFFDDNSSKESADAQTELKNIMVISFRDKEKYDISLYGLISSEEIKLSKNIGKIKISLNRINRFYDFVSMEIKVFNGENKKIQLISNKNENGKQDVTASFYSNILGKGTKGIFDQYNLFRIESYSVEPNSSANILLSFEIGFRDEITKVSFNNIMIGNEVKKVEIWR